MGPLENTDFAVEYGINKKCDIIELKDEVIYELPVVNNV